MSSETEQKTVAAVPLDSLPVHIGYDPCCGSDVTVMTVTIGDHSHEYKRDECEGTWADYGDPPEGFPTSVDVPV